MQSAMNSSTLLYPAAWAARFARSYSPSSILTFATSIPPNREIQPQINIDKHRYWIGEGPIFSIWVNLWFDSCPSLCGEDVLPDHLRRRRQAELGQDRRRQVHQRRRLAADRPAAEQHAGDLERVGAVVGAPGQVIVEHDLL